MKDFLRNLLLAIVVCCWSCSGGEDDVPTPTPKPETNKIEISTSAPVVEQKGGTASVSFTSNAAWTASVGASTSWLKVAPTSGAAGSHTLTITTEENNTYDERNATLTIKAGNASQNVTVTQKQKDALIVNSNKVELNSDGGDFSIEAKANVNVTFEIEESAKDWISASESRTLTTKTLYFAAKSNKSMERRQGNIILKGSDGLTETVTVYQEGEKPTLVITSDNIIVGSDGETIKIELKSNVEYTMILPEVDWINKEESRAISAYTHYLIIAPNETYDQRNAVVYFQNETESLKDSISIIQLQKDAIIVAKNEYEVEAESCTLEFSVNTNVDFKVETTVDWIKQNTDSRSLVEKLLKFTIAENDATIVREGKISITFKDLKQTIKITQKGAIDYESIERAALIELYKATGGDNWGKNTNWCSDKPLREWYGIIVNQKGRVREIYLGRNNLVGVIPESIGNLTELTELSLESNQLSGGIPESIGNLTELTKLFLDSNQLSGGIPESIGNLTALTRLELNGNQLTGSIPESIGNLRNLTSLELYYNKLTGEIPKSIGNLSELWGLNLSYNKLRGNIPESIGNLAKLVYLNITSNQLSGNIPESIGNLSELEDLYIYDNQLSGNIPESIGNLSELKSLNIHGNQLSGEVPKSIANLPNLEDFVLAENNLSGPLPELPKSENLFAYNMSYNFFTGNIPESHAKAFDRSATEYGCGYEVYFNNLSGDIPESMVKHKHWHAHWYYTLRQNQGYGFNETEIPAHANTVMCYDGSLLNLGEEYKRNEYTIIFRWWSKCPYSQPYVSPIYQLYQKYKEKGLGLLCTTLGFDDISYLNEHMPNVNIFNESRHDSYDNNPYGVLHQSFYLFYSGATPYFYIIDNKGNIIFYGSGDGNVTIPQYHANRDDIYDFVANLFGDEKYDPSIDIYTSTDYSRDGEVVTLQTASTGKGINLTFMGEAFVDKDMGDGGLYEQKMEEAMEKFFSIEPYKSMRNRFNVYTVKVISPNAVFTEHAVHRINQSDLVCFEYAQKIPDADKNPPMISVIYNTTYWTDRSYTTMYSDGSFVGYMMDGITNVLIHESGGHGFASLLDEYVEGGLENSTLPEDYQTYLDNVWETSGWGANVDWRNNASTVKWSHFLDDNRYSNEGLGLYEGAYLYGHGAYRPTENSMMRYYDAPFNAPSREQIYKRIMQRSEGETWIYNYEEFVKFDEKTRSAESRSTIKPLTEAEQNEYIRNHRPPIIIKGTWRDAMKGQSKVVVPLR